VANYMDLINQQRGILNQPNQNMGSALIPDLTNIPDYGTPSYEERLGGEGRLALQELRNLNNELQNISPVMSYVHDENNKIGKEIRDGLIKKQEELKTKRRFISGNLLPILTNEQNKFSTEDIKRFVDEFGGDIE